MRILDEDHDDDHVEGYDYHLEQGKAIFKIFDNFSSFVYVEPSFASLFSVTYSMFMSNVPQWLLTLSSLP